MNCFLSFWILVFSLLSPISVLAGDDTNVTCRSVTEAACNIALSLGKGINLGNMLDSPKEGDWGVTYKPEYAYLIAKDFQHVRLPVRWSNHASLDADAKIDEKFMLRVETIVDLMLRKNLTVILNVHHYRQLSGEKLDFGEAGVEPAVVTERFLNIWNQISERFAGKSNKLIFEVLNEPGPSLQGDKWNELAATALKVIRKSNPERIVMIGPSGNAIPRLKDFKVPGDKNIIVTVHNYDPAPFTLQGFSFMKQFPKGATCCDANQKAKIVSALDTAKSWGLKSGYPVHVGEFGVSKHASLESRVAYTSFFRKEAEARGFNWAYWEFGSNSHGVYDLQKSQWIPELHDALVK